MIRKLTTLALAVMALAACDLMQGNASRAPKHPSQSQPVAAPALRQVQISSENRQKVEQNLHELLNGYGAQHAAGRAAVPGVPDVITSLQPGADHQFRVTLTGGTAYSFLGACDNDCNDVDLELLQASDGLVVGSDLLTDDYPVVDFTPPANGDYFVRVILKTCTQAPCYVGARVLQAGGK
jgi:hypothetical protein